MHISERYANARQTSNLKSIQRTTYSSSDVLGAAGLAARDCEAAMLLWSCIFRGTTQSKLALVEILGKDLVMFMLRAKIDGDPRTIAKEVVAWWLQGNNCQSCGGLGYELVLGAPTLSDRICKFCRGTKKSGELPRTEPHDWLNRRMSKLAAIAGGKVMRKIADDLSDFS